MPVVFPHNFGPEENEAPSHNARLRISYVETVFLKGLKLFGGKLAGVTGLVGGSVLTYLIFVAKAPLPWALLAVVAAVFVIYAGGAYRVWSEAYDAAYRFCPTWEQLQARADTLRGVVFGHSEPERFKNQYLGGHMLALRQDYDRAVFAGYAPDFERDLIRTAELSDMDKIIAALEDAAERWKQDEEGGEAGSARKK